MKKLLVVLLIVALVAFPLVGCNLVTPGEGKVKEEVKEEVEEEVENEVEEEVENEVEEEVENEIVL